MSHLINLEEFEAVPDPSVKQGAARVTREDLDAQVSAAYEQGYSAGYEDAVRQEYETRQHISAELARNLQDLGFTFHEARSHVLRGLEPLLYALVGSFLPQMAAASLGPKLRDEIVALAEAAADREIELLVPNGQKDLVAGIVTDAVAVPLRIAEEPSLGPGQALLRAGRLERAVDLTAVINRMRDALNSLYSGLQGEIKHG